jgi:hypothetical protein
MRIRIIVAKADAASDSDVVLVLPDNNRDPDLTQILRFLAGSERLRNNRPMTDAAHNQHSETRRPSDRDRIVTTGSSRFQPARPEVLR